MLHIFHMPPLAGAGAIPGGLAGAIVVLVVVVLLAPLAKRAAVKTGPTLLILLAIAVAISLARGHR